jgi:hypothetical protein
MTRRRDHLIDKTIGSVIRMQRVKLGKSQDAVASTRIPGHCRILEISPNDLFGASERMNREVSQLNS